MRYVVGSCPSAYGSLQGLDLLWMGSHETVGTPYHEGNAILIAQGFPRLLPLVLTPQEGAVVVYLLAMVGEIEHHCGRVAEEVEERAQDLVVV